MAAQALEAIFYRGNDQNRTDYTPSGAAVANGKIVDLGQDIGVCTSPEGIDDGKLGSLAKSGVFKVAKAEGAAVTFAKSVSVFFDTVTRLAVAAAGANIIFIGIADEAAANGDNHVKTEINKLPVQNITGI